jgi:para-nitrobenzyl esterase
MAPACPQNDAGWNRADAARSQEDCLTLDIRTPALTGKRPVMVWIHGGSNRAGSAGGTVDSRITRHGVVLVAIQYRLGVLGFLAPREAAVGDTAGNYGLMDQIAALRWVRANIARFGGDPEQVTLFGESAGSQDVSLMLAAPEGQPLFKRAILESGTPGFGQPFRSLRNAFTIGDQAVRLAGGHGIAGLRAVSVERLLQIDRELADRSLHTNDFLWLKTTIDGRVLPASPRRLLAAAPRKAVIIGTNRAEFGPAEGTTDIAETLRRVYGAKAAEARRLYAFDEARRDPRLGHPALEIETDWVFRCPAVTLAAQLARQGWPVWSYEFDLALDGGLTSHAAEIPYVLDARPIGGGATLQDYWVNFALRGDPNGATLPRWPAFSTDARQYLAIGPGGVGTAAKLRAEICALRDAI